MKRKFNYTFINLNFVLFTILILAFTANADLTSYKTRADRQEEKMGSLTDFEGFSFNPKKVQNESTRLSTGQANINKYLWDAACVALKSIPITSMDCRTGIILTDWYSIPGQANKNFKVNIFINGDIITPTALDVRVFSQMLQNGKVITSNEEVTIAAKLEQKILEEARTLYINAQND